MGLEGIVSKRLSAPYCSGPSRDWIKVKNPDSPAMVAASRGALVMWSSRDYGWMPIESAPLDEDIALRVTDGRGGPYTLQWPCRRTATGWINARKGTPLERPYPISPPRPR
jgi:hypothetical protein